MSRPVALLLLLGSITIAGAGPAVAQQHRPIFQAFGGLADDLVARLDTPTPLRVAVMPFVVGDDMPTSFGVFIADQLVTHLHQTGRVSIVERKPEFVQQVLDELDLRNSGAYDAATIHEIGRLLGAEALVVGSVHGFATAVAVNSRLVDTERGELLGTGSVTVLRDDDVRKALGERVGRLATALRVQSSAETGGERQPPAGCGDRAAVREVRSGGLDVRLEGCSYATDGVHCLFRLATDRRKMKVQASGGAARVADPSGASYTVRGLSLDSEWAPAERAAEAELLRGSPVQLKLEVLSGPADRCLGTVAVEINGTVFRFSDVSL